MTIINDKFEELLKDRKTTLMDIERKTGLDHSHLSRIKNGDIKYPSINVVKKIANYFEISILYFTDDEVNWYENLSPELKKFVTKENIEYLKIIKKAKEKGLSPKILDKSIKFFNMLKE